MYHPTAVYGHLPAQNYAAVPQPYTREGAMSPRIIFPPSSATEPGRIGDQSSEFPPYQAHSNHSGSQVGSTQEPTTEYQPRREIPLVLQQHVRQHDVAQPGHVSLHSPAAEYGVAFEQGNVSPQQLQTPSEFALKMLFTQFVKMAEAKLNAMIHLPLQDSEPDILSPLKQGVDPKFDKLLASLGSIARHRPKPVIDCVMLWRKSRIEAVDDHVPKATSSLIEIVRQVDTLPDELGYRLEETVFNQLENVDPEFIQRSMNRTANMNVLVELMGSLSNVRFATVSDRFIAELEKYNKFGAQVKDKDRENRMEMLIRGMRYLTLKIYPMDSLEESADFLQSCARFFKASRGIRIKHAYAELFVQLLTPVAKVAVAEVNHPSWSKTVEILYPKARKMSYKPRHSQVAFPLVTILLCVSKKDFFFRHFTSVFDFFREKFKEKATRAISASCMVQLMWVFLFRYSDGTNSTFRTLDTLIKTLFPGNRKAASLMDGYLWQFVRIVHFIGIKHTDYATESIIFPLLSLDQLSNVIFTNLTLDMISPERMTVAIRAFMLILADLEKGGSTPKFPAMADVGLSAADEFSSDLLEPRIINRAGMKDTYEQVTAVLGKIAIVCDRNYGHTLILDEKYTTTRSMFSAAAIMATATGDSASLVVHQYSTFAVSYSKEKQIYFDLMSSCVNCFPRCMPSGIPLMKLVEMLSRYTAHVDPDVRKGSCAALVRIARQCNSQVVLTGYAAFLSTIEDRLSELLAGLVSSNAGSGSTSSSQQEEGLLSIYIKILEACIKEKCSKSQQAGEADYPRMNSSTTGAPLASDAFRFAHPSLTPEVSLETQVRETEEIGLLFLCNQQHAIRREAIRILKLAASAELMMEQANGSPNGSYGESNKEIVLPASVSVRPRTEITRVYHILQAAAPELLQIDEYGNALPECTLATHELIRLQVHHQKGQSEVFSQLAESEHDVDVGIWQYCFPRLISKIFKHFPEVCEPCLEMVSKRLMQIYPAIVTTTDVVPNTTLASKFSIKTTQVATDELVEQWRLYLVFVCSTMTKIDHQTSTHQGHGRKKSAPSEKITCARDLFRLILPLLHSDRTIIREAVVDALGRINSHLYKALLEDLQPFLFMVHEEFRSKNGIKPPYQGKRNKKIDRLRVEIARILALTAPLLKSPSLVHDEHILSSLMGYVKETLLFLLDSEVQHEWEYVRLRTHFCGFVSHLHNAISEVGGPETTMPFDLRLALFRLFEDWCGHGPNSFAGDNRSYWFGMDLVKDEETQRSDKAALEFAALSAMASLCQGPITNPSSQPKVDRSRSSFNIVDVFKWIDSVFSSPDTKLHPIAQRALEALLVYNQDQVRLLEDAIHQCYTGDQNQKFTQGHFSALVDIVVRIESYPCHVHQMLSLALFKCGDTSIHIRSLAIKLLKVIEARYFADPCVGEYEIGIINRLPTIYRQAQFVLSARLAQDCPEQTYYLLSETMMRFNSVSLAWQGEMLRYITPWLGNVELLVDDDDELSVTSLMVLTNLFYLTIKYGDEHVKEIENLWVQLVAGDNYSNIRPIIVFLLDLGLEKRAPGFVPPAKKVIVFLGRTSVCSQMVRVLVNEISPKAMVPKLKQERNGQPANASSFYLANLDEVLDGVGNRPAFSRGQLATVLLVDLAVEAGAELRCHLPLLLQALFVQLDHYTALICDQTRSLLVHLIHSIIIRESRSIEIIDSSTELVDFLSSKEGKPLWAYDDIITYNMRDSPELQSLVLRTVQLFESSEEDIRQQWGETALQWATACPVRHIACRSFQIFRTIAPGFNQHMLADMLARLSNTIADKSQEIQAFAMEILVSLQSIMERFDAAAMMQFPQIFWAAIACLYTGHEHEYNEGLKIIEMVLNRLDVMDPATLEFLLSYFPQQWDSAFTGIQPLLLKGLRSTLTEQGSLRLLRRLLFVPEKAFIDLSESRIIFLFLGVLPTLAHGLETGNVTEDCYHWARDVSTLAERDGYQGVVHLLNVYAKKLFRNKDDFWRQVSNLLRDLFAPELQAEIMVFLLRLLYHSPDIYKHASLRCLKVLIPYVDVSRPECYEIGPELVLPLLRLLQTDFSKDALEVLDAAMNLSEQSGQVFKIRIPNEVHGQGINFEESSKGVLGCGIGLERRSTLLMTGSGDPWSAPPGMPSITSSAITGSPSNNNTSNGANNEGTRRSDQLSQLARSNVNAVVSTCAGTGYWGTDVELLAEQEGLLDYNLGIVQPHPMMDMVDMADGMSTSVASQIYGRSLYGVDVDDMEGHDQYDHLMSALDDLTEHFAESARQGDHFRKRESLMAPSYHHQQHLVSDQRGLGLDILNSTSGEGEVNAEELPSTAKAQGRGGDYSASHETAAFETEATNRFGGSGHGDLLPSRSFRRGHHRGRSHGSKGSREEFGQALYSLSQHGRITEDEEEDTALMAAEILNKSLSINRSFSSIRSSFLMDPSNSVDKPPGSEAEAANLSADATATSATLPTTPTTTAAAAALVAAAAATTEEGDRRRSSDGVVSMPATPQTSYGRPGSGGLTSSKSAVSLSRLSGRPKIPKRVSSMSSMTLDSIGRDTRRTHISGQMSSASTSFSAGGGGVGDSITPHHRAANSTDSSSTYSGTGGVGGTKDGGNGMSPMLPSSVGSRGGAPWVGTSIDDLLLSSSDDEDDDDETTESDYSEGVDGDTEAYHTGQYEDVRMRQLSLSGGNVVIGGGSSMNNEMFGRLSMDSSRSQRSASGHVRGGTVAIVALVGSVHV
ncbi:Cell morphogenesis protein PAG1 [Actinomortierella wolfii]|nr:Cell morphogenesis protein PAG1 [Actinomortierella wolfii]